MSELVKLRERVAQAIAKTFFGSLDPDDELRHAYRGVDAYVHARWREWLPEADAALRTTLEVLEASGDLLGQAELEAMRTGDWGADLSDDWRRRWAVRMRKVRELAGMPERKDERPRRGRG